MSANFLRECFWPRDGRSTGEIKASVREELEAHIERLVDEQVRAGVPADEARRIAAAQFGDVDRYVAECQRIDLGERLIVRRAMAVACAVLLATTAYFGWRSWQADRLAQQLRAELIAAINKPAAGSPPAAAANNSPIKAGDQPAADGKETVAKGLQYEDGHIWLPPPGRDSWVFKLVALRDHMHTAFGVGPELTLLDPDEGVAIVRQAWPQLTNADVKTGLLKAFAFSKALTPHIHPRLFQILDLGMTDPNPEIRNYAASYLRDYAPEDFRAHPERYAAWYREHSESAPEDLARTASN